MSEYDDIGDRLGDADGVVAELRRVLEGMWYAARRYILNAERISLDQDIYVQTARDHMGDPQHVIDRLLHQYGNMLLHSTRPEIPLYGEEEPPVNIAFDLRTFNYIGYLDALDGTRQAFALPGGWSINLLLQRFVGTNRLDGAPIFQGEFLGVIDAEGVSVCWAPALEGVDIQIAGSSEGTPNLYSDQLTVSESEFGLTGVTTVLAGGYKKGWWDDFKRVREACSAYPVFNTAGAPVARKALQNADIVIAEPRASTLWDGVGAGLIAAAGGHVVRVDSDHPRRGEPLTQQEVIGWFSQYGYERNSTAASGVKERYCVPPFVAGMDMERVVEVASAYLGSVGSGRG